MSRHVERVVERSDPTWDEDLAAHCEDLFRSLSRSDQRRAGQTYLTGLLRCSGRKSIRHIAGEMSGGYSDQSLQQFVNQSRWDPGPVRRRLAAGSAPAAWVVDEVAFRKHGRSSAGVERQYVGSLGRLSNCQLGHFVARVDAGAAVPITWRLSLPRSWDVDDERRRKARVPDEERHQPSWRYQVEALDDLFGDWGVPAAPVVLDLSQAPSYAELVEELEDRGLDFLVRVGATAPLARPAGLRDAAGRRPLRSGPGGTMGDLGEVLSALPRTTVSWVDPRTGAQVRAQFTRTSTHALLPGRTGRGQVLMLEWGLGKRVPRGFWLTNLVERDLDDLVALTRLPAQVDLDIATMIERFGLCDYEGRTFPGWHHHVTLASAAYAFHLSNPMPASTADFTKSGGRPRGMTPTVIRPLLDAAPQGIVEGARNNRISPEGLS